jgi:hypothetical protein
MLMIALLAVAAATVLAGPVQYTTAPGYNACSSACGCTDSDCSDVKYPFKYLGSFKTDGECETACTAAGCAIWVHSASTEHCFSRGDGKWEVQPRQGITSGCTKSVVGCSSTPKPPAPPGPPGPPVPFVPTNASNMNGAYLISLTPEGKAAATKYPTNFKDYPRGVEYFDVYSPDITSLYSQVFWTGLPPVDLPADIVARYAGKDMAVVGFEVDQVRKGAGPNGEDVSLPINVAYNHHFESNMKGANAEFELIKFTGPDDPRIAELSAGMAHGLPNTNEHWIVKDNPGSPKGGIASSQAFGGGNGGEYRKSFHGYPPGYARVIHSPEQFQMTPMQIDTWHRTEMNLTGSKFVQGPIPRNAWSARSGSQYSGLLECPVSTRIHKQIETDYAVQQTASCGAASIATPTECFAAVPTQIGGAGNNGVRNTFKTAIVDDPGYPAGCSVTADATNPMVYHVVFNTAASGAACGGTSQTLMTGATSSLVNLTVAVDAGADLVTITMAGPAGVWFGAGMGAKAMKDAPWAIIVDGTGNVTEHKLADQGGGSTLAVLAPSIVVKSNAVVGKSRTVVVTRALKGAGPDYYTFSIAKLASIPFINAVGNTPALAFHASKAPTSISVLAAGPDASAACLCSVDPKPFGSGVGKLVYYPNTTQAGEKGKVTAISFGNRCAAEPRGDLLAEHNPTCDVRSYLGGQSACHHMWSLLDADQDIPWPETPLVYQQKWRFWIQPYNASYHTQLKRTTWGIGSPVEYDVPKCGPDVRGCSKDPKSGRWIHTIRGEYSAGGDIVAAHFHCHAPTCKSMSMYTCPSTLAAGECNETTGTLICTEEPVYGGTGMIDNKAMDEPGFILQPPCLFGHAEQGLQAPVTATGTMFTIKTSYADYGHHGEMAWQQMYVVQ